MLKKILLAEDNEAEAEIVQLLIDAKYKNRIDLIVLDNGLKVIDYINNNEIDLLLLDINIPGVNGKEIAKYIRNQELYFPVIILSTSDTEDDVKECYRYCVNSYLVKPIDFNVFEEMFDRVIQYWMDFNEGL